MNVNKRLLSVEDAENLDISQVHDLFRKVYFKKPS